MSEQPRSRQDIYDRIRQSSKDEVILDEMIRLGFWPADGDLPDDPSDEIRRKGAIERELAALHTEHNRLQDAQAMLRALRKQRLEDSRRKQQETKARREQQRREQAAAWQQRKAREVLYLGEGVSAGLGLQDSDTQRLTRLGLPLLNTPLELAQAMNLDLAELRFLAFHREVSQTSHYRRFTIPKKTGGQRLIAAPMPRLKRTQHWILAHILQNQPVHTAAHGFRPGHSIVSNAAPHCGQAVVINLDLQDFFPSVDYRRIKGLFRALGYGEAVATVLALLCSEPQVETVELDGRTWQVALGPRHLPQGAPTSPAITNLLCRRLDRRLSGLAAKLGFAYTRYADDLSFSTADRGATAVGRLLRGCRHIVKDEGFTIHPDKTRVMHRGRRQEVTGLVVNRQAAVPRDVLRRFRALLYQIEKDGPKGKVWNHGSDVLAGIRGFADYVFMVDPDKGTALQARVRRILAANGREA